MVVVVIGAGLEPVAVAGLGEENIESPGVGVGEVPSRSSCALAAAATKRTV